MKLTTANLTSFYFFLSCILHQSVANLLARTDDGGRAACSSLNHHQHYRIRRLDKDEAGTGGVIRVSSPGIISAFCPAPPVCVLQRRMKHCWDASRMAPPSINGGCSGHLIKNKATGTWNKSKVLHMVTTDGDNYFMTLLQKRINQVKENENKIPIIVLDCMLPRQVLRIEANDNMLLEVVRHQMFKENPTFGMLGAAPLNAWEKIHLNTGVEVEIIQKPNFVLGKGVMLELKAKRRFMIIEDEQVKITKDGWSEATVEYLDSRKQEQMELSMSNDDRLCIMRAIEKSKELTMLNNPKLIRSNNGSNESLVGRWIELARKMEKRPGQVDKLLEDIGKIPPENEPSERAFWIGALINPLPSMGVSMDIRPALLTATTAEKRVDIACEAILKSIRHMEGTEKMW